MIHMFIQWYERRPDFSPDYNKDNLNRFFGSVIYQTEKPEYMFQMEFFFGRIIRALLNLADTGDSDDRMNFYGSFDR